MTSSLPRLRFALALMALGAFTSLAAAKDVWTDAKDPTLGADFHLQGEYTGDKIGAQVIALGNKALQVVVLPGGLPGAGWDGEHKCLVEGTIDGEKATLSPAKGKKNYLAQSPAEFSATSKNPPAGQKDYSGTISGGTLTLKGDDGKTISLKRVTRESPTAKEKPPAGALVLFDGSNTSEWTGGKIDPETKSLLNEGHDILTKKKFLNYTAHCEFLLPYRPDARGQGRGNSGFYQVDLYEIQILDSFGLDGKDNECGGVYTKLAPKVNMCLPPLEWQTYDVDFTSAVRDDKGKKTADARITLKHNGVLIHDNAKISGITGGSRNEPEGTPGPLKLQGHGNPLQFRNIWIVEKK
ncbi:MAG TPA: DUF1080 domain-containing protein [Pirellulales bacterium]|jgi:hypothetical protein|nr:DUF1080 domain-containing protein [Pirellulales bacterium]